MPCSDLCLILKLEDKVKQLNEDLSKAKNELESQQAERTRITQLEVETNEKLMDVHEKLLQAGVEQRESERDVKFKETLQNLQRLFPGQTPALAHYEENLVY